MSDINKKNTPDQMRILMKRMRTGNDNWQSESNTQQKGNLEVRDMLKITRRLHEENETMRISKKNVYDQPSEEKKMISYFRDLRVNIKFVPLEVYDDFVFWGGTIDGIIQFAFKVTPDESTTGVEFNYLSDFSPDNPINDKIIERVKGYYEIFETYWQNNIVQPSSTQSDDKSTRTISPWAQQQVKNAAE